MTDQTIDVTEGLARLGGNRDLYGKLLAMMQENLDEGLARIQELTAAGDYATAAKEAHLLKGIAANVGATALVDAMAHLERELKQDVDKYRIMFGELNSMRDDIEREISVFSAR